VQIFYSKKKQELEEIAQKNVKISGKKKLSFALCHDPEVKKMKKQMLNKCLNRARLVKLAHIIEKMTLRNPRGEVRFAPLEKTIIFIVNN
jgi:hypothetical protein